MDENLSIEEKAKKLGISQNTCRTYIYSLLSTFGYVKKNKLTQKSKNTKNISYKVDELKQMDRNQLEKNLGLSSKKAEKLHYALRYFEVLSDESISIKEMAKKLNFTQRTVFSYRSQLVNLGLVKSRRRIKILKLRKKYGLSYFDTSYLSIALKPKNLAILLDPTKGNDEKAKELGLSKSTVDTCVRVLEKCGIKKTKKEYLVNKVLKEIHKRGLNSDNLSRIYQYSKTKLEKILSSLEDYDHLTKKCSTRRLATTKEELMEIKEKRKLLEEIGLYKNIPSRGELAKKHNI